MYHSVIIDDLSQMAGAAEQLVPGAYLVLLMNSFEGARMARGLGFAQRDAMLIFSPDKVETAYFFRKALSESTVAANSLKHGAGGVNVEACRVSWGGEKPTQEEWNKTGAGGNGDSTTAFLQHTAIRKYYAAGLIPVPTGRWPTNLIVIHSPECQLLGTQQVPSTTCSYPEGDEGRADTGTWRIKPTAATARGYGTDGIEEAPLWACSDSCVIPQIDLQSGTTSSNPNVRHNKAGSPTFKLTPIDAIGYADRGGGSRFFPQFKTREEALAWIEKLITPVEGNLLRA